MEIGEKERINKNLDTLVLHTKCLSEFLAYLFRKDVLSVGDCDKIKACKEETEKANTFYSLITTKDKAFPELIQALKITGQHGIVELLETNVVPSSLTKEKRIMEILKLNEGCSSSKRPRMDIPTPQTNVKFDVTPPVSLFTGRREELADLHQKILLQSGESDQRTSISGLGGIGKTQLARQYILEHGDDFDNNIIWLHAATEDGLSDCFRILAKDKLALTTKDASGSDKEIQTVVGEVYKYFEVSKCLFVFDNAEKETWFKEFLPENFPRGSDEFRPYVLITSREQMWYRGTSIVPLKELDSVDAIRLVKKGLNLKEDDGSQDNEISSLVQLLQCFPLAIQQAISYIQHQSDMDTYDIRHYLDDFSAEKETTRQKLLEFRGDDDPKDKYTLTTFTTWNMTVKKIGQVEEYGSTSITILKMMAYINPDKIKREFFKHMPGNLDESHLKWAVGLLVKYSMVDGQDKQSLLSIHRLVQEVTRIELVNKNEEVNTLENVFRTLNTIEEVAKGYLRHHDNHMVPPWEHAWKYPELVQSHSSLISASVSVLLSKGNLQEALKFGEDALKRLANILPDDHINLLDIHNSIGQGLYLQGRTEEAEQRLLYAAKKVKKIYGADSSQTLPIQEFLSDIYIKFGRLDEALTLLKSICPIKSAQLGDMNPYYLSSEVKLAKVLKEMGRKPEATNILKTVCSKVEMRKFCDLTVELEVLEIYYHLLAELGDALITTNQFTEARQVLQVYLKMEERVPGEIGPGLKALKLWNVHHLMGDALRGMGRPEEAQEKHEQAYQIHLGLGELVCHKHAYIIYLKETAKDLVFMGKQDEAIGMLEGAVSKEEEIFAEINITQKMGIYMLLIELYVMHRMDFGKALKVFRKLSRNEKLPEETKQWIKKWELMFRQCGSRMDSSDSD